MNICNSIYLTSNRR